jgi:hypothetical protein
MEKSEKSEPVEDVAALPTDSDALRDLKPEDKADAGTEYVTGFKLAVVVASVSLSCFLMLLDTMVVSTVITSCSPSMHPRGW